jgi:hypothetical protein
VSLLSRPIDPLPTTSARVWTLDAVHADHRGGRPSQFVARWPAGRSTWLAAGQAAKAIASWCTAKSASSDTVSFAHVRVWNNLLIFCIVSYMYFLFDGTYINKYIITLCLMECCGRWERIDSIDGAVIRIWTLIFKCILTIRDFSNKMRGQIRSLKGSYDLKSIKQHLI